MSVFDLSVVRQLGRGDLPAIRQHLLGLDDFDRVQRFAQPAADHVVERYLYQIDLTRDALFGVDARSAATPHLIGLCHLAMAADASIAEAGISVDATWRRQGVAGSLLERAMLRACNIGIAELVMYFLPYNTNLADLARWHGMRISIGDGQGIARLSLQAPSMASISAELFCTLGEAADHGLRRVAAGACASSTAWREAISGGPAATRSNRTSRAP